MATLISSTFYSPSGDRENFLVIVQYSGNWYALGREGGAGSLDDLSVWKASTPTGTWTEQDSSNRPSVLRDTNLTLSGANSYMNGWAEGSSIYVVAGGGTDLSNDDSMLIYAEFDMSSDTWVQVSGTDTEYYIYSVDNNDGDKESNNNFHQVRVRPDGDVIVGYNGTRTASKGNDYSRVYYARLESSTWTVDVAVGAGTNEDEIFRGIAMQDDGDCVIMYKQSTTTYWKILTNANSLGSANTSTPTWRTTTMTAGFTTHNTGESLLLGVNTANDLQASEYVTGETNTNHASSGVTTFPLAYGWDAVNDLAYTLHVEISTNDLILSSFDVDTATWTEVATVAASWTTTNYMRALYLDGTIAHYLYKDSSNNIYYDSYTYGSTATVGKVDGITWANMGKTGGVAKASIGKVMGIAAP